MKITLHEEEFSRLEAEYDGETVTLRQVTQGVRDEEIYLSTDELEKLKSLVKVTDDIDREINREINSVCFN